jgi:hexosaminidase
VDSQSFPLEIPGFPEVSQKGAYSSSSVYSANDVTDIVSYAGAVRSSHFVVGNSYSQVSHSAESMLCLRLTRPVTPLLSPSLTPSTSLVQKPLPGLRLQMVSFFSISPSTSYLKACYAEPPAGQLRFASPDTAAFTTKLLAAAAKLSPSTLFSTGGDELNVPCYTNDTETQQLLNSTGKTLEQALDTFTQTTHKALIAEGKTPVVWEGRF